jgi:hypothetical protein
MSCRAIWSRCASHATPKSIGGITSGMSCWNRASCTPATLRSSDFQPATLGHNEGCIDEALFFVQCASIAKLVGNIRQHATQDLIAAPSLKAPMHGFVVWVALRQLGRQTSHADRR